MQRLQHLRRKSVDGEDRDHRAGPENGDEGHTLAVAGVQQVNEGEVFALGLCRQVLQAKISAVDAANNPLRFGVAAFTDQPARRFRGPQTHQEQQGADNSGAGQGQAPGLRATKVKKRFPHQIGGSRPGKPEDGQGSEAGTAIFLRQKLHQESRRDRVLNPYRDAVEEAQGKEYFTALNPVLRQRADDKQRRADEVEQATAQAVGESTANKAAKEDADQRRGGDHPLPEGA